MNFLIVKSFYCQNIESNQLLKLGLILELDGYELTHQIEFDYLRKGQVSEYTLILNRNIKYVIFATCDRDCGDIDLFLYDMRGNKLTYSDDTSDKPILMYQPAQTQVYKIVVFMYDCSINPCRYGLAVYGK
jgi:hypothetical protein